ncbi:hypothetical protein HDV05_005516 [Chytridiales sp. JEL 0842]|nr:hypothetical protein HDV05_005516 [Chytridiales sp. JEL 0842]
MRDEWMVDPSGYSRAWNAFCDRAQTLRNTVEWDPAIYGCILDVMISKRPRYKLSDPVTFAQVRDVLKHMEDNNFQPSELTTALLVKAYAEEDIAVFEFQEVYRNRLKRELEASDEQKDPDNARKVSGDITSKTAMTGTPCEITQFDKGKAQLLPSIRQVMINDLHRKVENLGSFGYHDVAKKYLLLGIEECYDFNVKVFNAVLKSFSIRGDVKNVLEILKLMKEQGVDMDAASYGHVVHAYGVSGDVQNAHEHFNMFRASDLPTSAEPYYALIDAFVASNDVKSAVHVLLTILPQDNVKLTSDFFSSFFRSLLQRNQPAVVLQWYDTIVSDKTGELPKRDYKMDDLAFEAAVLLEDFQRATELFPGLPARVSSATALCDYGLLALRQSPPHWEAAFGTAMKLKACQPRHGPPYHAFFDAYAETLLEHNHTASKIFMLIKIAKSARCDPDTPVRLFIRALFAIKEDFVQTLQTYRNLRQTAENIPPGASFADFRLVRYIIAELYRMNGRLQEDGTGPRLDVEDFTTIFSCIVKSYTPHMNKAADNAVRRSKLMEALEDMLNRKLTPTLDQFQNVLDELRKRYDAVGAFHWIQRFRDLGIYTGVKMKEERATLVRFILSKEISSCLSRAPSDVKSACEQFDALEKRSLCPTLEALESLMGALARLQRYDDLQDLTERALALQKVKRNRVVIIDLLLTFLAEGECWTHFDKAIANAQTRYGIYTKAFTSRRRI